MPQARYPPVSLLTGTYWRRSCAASTKRTSTP
nr:MAG TPA: hypothetical protein [Caudoviricetes sp.]DAX06846.1 MAG TPA: hypothetical protein [Bacteriophage sp.]DAX63629.1 MAG TPA: hypothetical protein [Bacteriophage sp.]